MWENKDHYAVLVCLFASLGGVFFGYDQGITGGLLILKSFLKDFCVGYGGSTFEQCIKEEKPPQWITFTTMFSFLYYLGCVFGVFVCQYVAYWYGRRRAIAFSCFIFISGTSLIVSTDSHTIVLTCRFIVGVSIGSISFITPLYGAECAPAHLRGAL